MRTRLASAWFVAPALAVLLLAACAESDPESGPKATSMKLSERSSGYHAAPGDWTRFLECWRRRVATRDDEMRALTVLPARPSRPDGGAYAPRIAKLEARLGVALPKSYRHFLAAERPEAVADPAQDQGLFAPEQVGRLADVAPDEIAIAREHRLDADDARYFRYGTDQDDAAGRSALLLDAIVVGRFGGSRYERILLFPGSRTADGEMEAALAYHAGEFRAPSFAELMRQLSVLETQRPGHVPPYAQARLVDTCAMQLPLRDIWWR